MRAFVVETWSSRGAEDEPARKRPGWRMPAWPSRTTIARTVRVVGAVGFLLGTAVWMAHLLRQGHEARPTVPQPPGSTSATLRWHEIDKPAPLYRLEAPDFADRPVSYTARRHDAGSREDVLALGAFDGTAPALRLRIFRRTNERASATPLFAAIAHEAAQAGLSVEHASLPEILPTRFGRFEIADVTLIGGSGSPSRTCSGFRLSQEEPALSISGLACGAAAAALPRPALVCLIDRLDIGDAGDDRALAAFFARTEANKDPSCADTQSAPDIASLAAETREETGKPATSRKSLRRRHDF